MRYTRYIAAFVALILAASCTISDIDDTPTHVVGSKGQLQVVGRITQFSDCDVATRSKKEGDEPKVTSMSLALFPIDASGNIGNCVYYDYEEGGSIVFIVDRHDSVFDTYTDAKFVMYIFANMQDAVGFPTTSDAGVGKSLDYFTKCNISASTDIEKVLTNGFPMMGSLGAKNTTNAVDGDDKEFILKPTADADNVDGLPKVDGAPTDNLEIPLKSMYAKCSFTISVKPDQEIVGNKAPRFDLTGYTVHNLAATVDTNSGTDSDTVTDSNTYSYSIYAQGATTASFYFYIPERELTPDKSLEDVLPDELKKGTYDTTVDADQNGYRDEDEKYHQRFKPLLPGDSQNATYITIEGKFTDHQGHTYDVSYNIYLGGNNYDDFNIIRNTHYNNTVTIKGIQNSSDQATNGEAISIDHRVNVERSTPLVINFRRETLLDAHYEVRPLRLRLVGENIPTGTSATVEILNEDGTANDIPSWVRMETSGSTSDHITTGVSAGKRKYFTTDLVTNTLASNTSIDVANLSTANQTLWIYIDENTTTQSRAAIVRISHQGVDTDYKIVQNGLFEVVGAESGNTYYIEQYEEYLYNYDAEDSYGQTKDEGMVWGLEGVQLSNEHQSFYIDESDNTAWTNYTNNYDLPTYDFYTAKHDGSFVTTAGGTVHSFAGQHFTEDIVKKSNNGVNNITMDQQPSGAVEYCYNRNKRNPDGSISKVQWYLPSADELEDFIVPAYASFKEFQDNYYWTSQPAYIRNIFFFGWWQISSSNTAYDIYTFDVYDDNPEYARATKVNYNQEIGEFGYAKSGLNDKPNPLVNFTGSGEENRGYFYGMYIWKGEGSSTTTYPTSLSFGKSADTFGGTANGKTYTGEEYNYYKDGKAGSRYHVHLGHLYDMTQEGYHHRTQQKNRVRCVRADKIANNQQMALVYTVSDTPATKLDESGNTMYVMRNTNNTNMALTTSDSNLAVETITDENLDFDNYVVVEGNYIKSVAKNQYFTGTNDNVSFDNSGTSYTISLYSSNQYRISATSGRTTYYLKQTNTTVQMSSGDSGNRYWYFYEVKKEYKVVE